MVRLFTRPPGIPPRMRSPRASRSWRPGRCGPRRPREV